MKAKVTLAIMLQLGLVFYVSAQVLESSPYLFPAYAELPAWMRAKYTPGSYAEEFGGSAEIELTKIRYVSDGLSVVGFVYQKKSATPQKSPVIIYNRPGIGEPASIGNHNFRAIYEMHRCAKSGFLVIASQYRGVGGGEGKDEVGGADVHDVLNLLPIIKSNPGADADNIFIWGSSRGGSMALQALRDGMPLRAVALVGAVTDWDSQLKHDDRVGREYWPDYEKRRVEHVRYRSVLSWTAELPNVPILIMHGGNDTSVEPAQALQFAERLNDEGRLFELAIYANDDHLLTKNLDRKIDQVIDWFTHPRLASIAKAFDRINKKAGIGEATLLYKKTKDAAYRYYDFREAELNRLGYTYLFTGREKDAISVFKLNAEAYPKSSSAWECIGEAYEKIGEKDQAIRHYNKALELDPKSKSVADALSKLKN